MTDERKVKNRVRAVRMRQGMSQSQLARLIGVTRQTVLGIEKGKLNPSVGIALQLARVLGEPADYLFYLDAAGGETEGTAGAALDDDSEPAKGIWDFV